MRGRFGGLSFYAWLIVLLTATALIYLPGLQGSFLFDDYANLPSLGETGPIRDFASFSRYITSGTADPTGRPVSLLTFLLDANDWPAAPYPFKRTNLILHLLNGALLAILLRRLGRLIYPNQSNRTVDRAALLGAALWIAHPLFVSTTLYIVQREAMLPATTTLIGLLLWLSARHHLEEGRNQKAWMFAGAILCVTAAGTLAKANGILLPLFIVVIESVAPFRAGTASGELKRRQLSAVVAGAPSFAIGAYLAWQGVVNAVRGFSNRPWTIIERLLTEPRVLWDYLRLLWMPTPFTSGVFNDGYLVSTSLWTPWTTIPALLGLLALGVGAWHFRRRHPGPSLAVLFFLAGHALESTTIPLEIYFEHRNYLPAMLLFWPLALWLGQPPRGQEELAPWKIVLSAVMVVALGSMTYANATLWGDTVRQALVWVRLRPDSPRAQVLAAQNEVKLGEPQRAIDRLAPLLAKHPDQVQVSLNLLSAECSAGKVSDSTLGAAATSMRTALDSGTLLTSWFLRAIDVAQANECKGLTLDALDRLASAGMDNDKLPVGRKQDLVYVRGRIALAGSKPELASARFKEA
ncbi:MAG: tetratricopeptide repeat protein, partial [Luteibacter jiangsuensis]